MEGSGRLSHGGIREIVRWVIGGDCPMGNQGDYPMCNRGDCPMGNQGDCPMGNQRDCPMGNHNYLRLKKSTFSKSARLHIC